MFKYLLLRNCIQNFKCSYNFIFSTETLRCDPLSDPQNGIVLMFPNGKSAVYTCNSGFTFVGTALVQCISGEWSSPPPTCVQP